ncbi:MAG: AgmX/PglI C-terminal domain-containing protein [Myxococcota bacterium]|nr:AgmX/PglI C-terminal domain-containing protein [Myxococcota bacterium]
MPARYVRVLIVAPWVLVACGGAAPAPKVEDDAVEHRSSRSDNANKDGPDSPKGAAASSPAAAPAATNASSGDLVAPQSDDPWMAPHQMAASDVLKVVRAASGKVNGCWHAAKKRDSFVGGEVKIKFVVTHEGSVRVWRNEDSNTSDEELIKCVGDVIHSLKFPTQKSPGDAWGIYQINFGG